MEGEAGKPGVITWKTLLELAEQTDDAELDRRIAAQAPEDLCTLIYTSGTTGDPKGVMLSQHNIVWTSRALADAYEFDAGDRIISYLPLSHIAEQMLSLHGTVPHGACAWFAESLERLGANLPEVRPHIFFAVPRVWEKIQGAMHARAAQSSGLKKRIGAWARKKGLAAGYAAQRGKRRPSAPAWLRSSCSPRSARPWASTTPASAPAPRLRSRSTRRSSSCRSGFRSWRSMD